jgi:hypothetical protein
MIENHAYFYLNDDGKPQIDFQIDLDELYGFVLKLGMICSLRKEIYDKSKKNEIISKKKASKLNEIILTLNK